MEATRQAGIKLNYDKCIMKTKSCSFFGNVYTPAGVKPDPKKVEAINNMEAPMNKQQLQSFLGMVTYLGQFVQNVSDMTYNMRKLLKKNALFQWTETHEADFQKLKEVFTSQECLAYFDQKKDIFLQVDASIQGLGAALMQKDQQGRLKPGAYASKSLTDAEKRYSNIECELLAVVFGCSRFHHYLYGRKFVCHSDHKPLEDIHLKHLSDAPARLQRLLLKLQPYNVTIQYIPGKNVAVADALSRVNPNGNIKVKGLDVTVQEISPCISHLQLVHIKKTTQEDQVLQMLMSKMIEGFPEHIKQLPVVLRPFWQIRDDLSIEHSCMAYQGRYYIPKAIREQALASLHIGHPGMLKMKLRAQQSMYWLGINKDIENHVMSCDPCQVNGRSQQKEPIIPFEVPNRPWQRVGIDLFHHNKGCYVIVADYYSKYPWIQALPATASKDVISALKSCFAEYGIPEDVISDNGSQFTSQEYQLFAASYGFKLTTSSPHYPRGHGFVE